MSQVSTYVATVRPGNIPHAPSFGAGAGSELLRRAVSEAARALGGRLLAEAEDAYGAGIAGEFAIATREVPRGVAIRLDPATGALEMRFDKYGRKGRAAGRIVQEVEMWFVALATMKALEARGNEVQLTERMVDGVRRIVLLGRVPRTKRSTEATISEGGRLVLDQHGFPSGACRMDAQISEETLSGMGVHLDLSRRESKKEPPPDPLLPQALGH